MDWILGNYEPGSPFLLQVLLVRYSVHSHEKLSTTQAKWSWQVGGLHVERTAKGPEVGEHAQKEHRGVSVLPRGATPTASTSHRRLTR